MSSDRIEKSDEEWRGKLTPEQYRIMREKGTEAPFTGVYVHTDEKGKYRCAACGQELFASDAKFDSGTGWPSFTEAIPGSVTVERDQSFGTDRTEVRCARCGGHLGHVFDDGPQPSGKRFCINSCSLDLKEENGGKENASQS